MKVLMSAYHCEPDRGSEFETGWQAMRTLAAACDELIVVTRSLSRNNSERGLTTNGLRHVRFIYYNLPSWLSAQASTPVGGQVVPYCWEIGLFFFLLTKYRRNEFDRSHRATVGSYRFPSFLWYFSRHFTWGPIASGELVPLKYLSIMSWKGRLLESIRILIQYGSFMDPFILLGLYKAREITVATTATKNILPGFARRKAFITNQYYIVDAKDFTIDLSIRDDLSYGKIKLLYTGRILEWKGIMMVLKALKKLKGKLDYEFNIVGDGPDQAFLQDYVTKHQLQVHFLGRKPRNELSNYFLTHHLFVGTDLHGRGSNAMLEAKMHHLPVLMLDITDPDQHTGTDLNIVVPTHSKSVSKVIDTIAAELLAMHEKSTQTKLMNH